MLIFLHGEDDFSMNRRRRDLVSAFRAKYPDASVSMWDFEDDTSPEYVRRALSSCEGGLFSSRRLVTFLHPSALEGPAAEPIIASLGAYAGDQELVALFVQSGKVRKSDKMAAAITKHADKDEAFPALGAKDASGLMKAAEKELSAIAAGLRFSRPALSAFIGLIGDDRARIVSELEKLAAYKGGEGEIGMEDIAALVAGTEESAIFEALDALGRNDRSRALILLEKETEGGEGVYPVLSMCAWQVRRMILVREAYDQGMRRAGDIASATKLAPFAVEKMLRTIGGFPLVRLKAGLALLSESDTKLKTGAMDPQVALSLFVWKF